MAAATVLVAVVLAVLWSTGMYFDESATAQAQQLLQTKTPHTLEGRADCLLCHGPNGTKPAPASHAGRPVTTCLTCHPAASESETKPISRPEAGVSASANKGQPSRPLTVAGPKDNPTCLMCHGNQGMTTKIGGDEVSISVDGNAYADSVHGKQVGCVDCHSDKTGFPHEKTMAADARSYAVELSKSCQKCHQSTYDDYRGSVHGQAIASGNNNAAVCADCHTAHAIGKATPLTYKADTCSKCHPKVVESYNDSVHGKLVASGKKDAATCIDCHTGTDSSAHKLQAVNAPDSVTSGKNVAETCGKCHTKVAENYASTFHGKAMRLGTSGAAPTCVDCHGAYGIQRVHGPESPLTEDKIGQTCAKCHSGANQNFAGGWMGHEEPSPSWFPAVFITERFLFFLTTSVVAFGIVHVELDLLRWLVSGRKKKRGSGGE